MSGCYARESSTSMGVIVGKGHDMPLSDLHSRLRSAQLAWCDRNPIGWDEIAEWSAWYHDTCAEDTHGASYEDWELAPFLVAYLRMQGLWTDHVKFAEVLRLSHSAVEGLAKACRTRHLLDRGAHGRPLALCTHYGLMVIRDYCLRR